MKQFLRYILTLVVILLTTTPAWAAWAGSGSAVKEVNGTYYVVYQDSYETLNTIEIGPTILLSGPGELLQYEAKGSSSLTGAGRKYFYYSYSTNNGGNWTDESQDLTTSYAPYEASLANNVNAIRFLTITGSIYTKEVKNIRVTMAQYIEDPSKTTIEFGSGKVDDTNSVASFTIPWCNVPAMTYTIEGSGSDCINISVKNNSELGKYNTATFTITYDRTKASNLDATLTIKNSYNNYSKTIIITGSTSKYDQTISWNNESAIETNMQLGRTQTVTATATSGLAVTYSSSDNNVLTVDANGKITAVGIGNATITASQAGNYKYNAAPSKTKNYTVWNKNTPIFTPNGFNEANVCHLKVGDKVTLEVLNVSDGLSGDFKVNTANNILGITRNGNTITIEALNAGTADAIFTQTENNDIFGAEKKYQFSVSKINNTLAIASTSYTKYVDDEITNIISSVNSDATVTTTSSDATIAYYDVTNNKIVIPNSEAKSFSSRTITITIAQAETYKYTAAEKTITLTVNKYTPTFTWNAGNATYYYLSSIPNIFSTTNPDCQYTIVSDNEHVAKVIDNTLHIYNVEETANITVTQAENYKWNGKTETYKITPANPNNHVTFTINSENYYNVFRYDNTGDLSWRNDGVLLGSPDVWSESGNYDDRYYDIAFTGIPDKLSFTYERSTSIATGCDWYVKESVDGVTWSKNNVWEKGDSNSGSVEVQLNPTTRYLRFCYSGNYGGYFRNVKVTELEKFEADPNPLDFGTRPVGEGEQLLLLNFSHANAGRITTDTIIGKDAKYFTVMPTVIPGTGRDMLGTTHLNVTFANNGEDRGLTPYEATLVITDNAGHREEVQLTGIRHGKSTPIFTWNPNNFPYYFNTSIANIVVSSNTDYANCPLKITSSNENIAKVENGRLYIYDQSGEVTFTVTQQENDRYYKHTESFTFTPKAKPDLEVPFQVTPEIYSQAITVGNNCSWDGDDHHLKLGDGAWDDTKKTAILVFSGRPDKLTFTYATSYNLAVVEIGSFDNPKWEVEESTDGENWKSIWSVRTNSTSWANAEIQLSETTQYVRFSYDGNYAGYFKNINISELVGYKYLRAADGHYLSRGAKWGTQAVVDAFGVVSRLSRYTHDNENIYTRFFFVDNEQYMFETETEDEQRLHEVFTDHGTALNTNHLWQINDNGGIFTIQSANEVGVVSHKGNYITAVNGVLAFTTNEAEATKWQMEDYTEHPQYITDMLNRQAAAAALKDFGQDVNTLEKVRSRLREEEFEVHEITIPALTLGEQTGESRTVEGMPQIYEQTITGLDTGFYRLTVKALYRISNSEIAWKCYQEKGKESVLAYAYANDVQYPIQSVYASYHSSAIENTDELRDGKYYSTTLSSANVAFNDANRYLNDVYVYVEADPGKTTGTLRYGIKCPSYVPGAWLAYSTITLTRFGRKEYIFHGSNSDDWDTPSNWNRNEVPNQYHNVRILANATIASHAEVFSLTIDPNVSIHITPTGGLSVGANGIQGAASDGSSIVLDILQSGAGFLRFSPAYQGSMPRTTVNYQTRSTLDTGANKDATWQYIGAPGENTSFTVDYITWLYHWSETQGWINKTGTLTLEPFAGYAITQYGQPTYKLITTPIHSNRTITLTKTDTEQGMKGDNLIANSFMAPIDVKNFTKEDFKGDMDMTFYIFNSGSWNQWNGQNEKDSTIGGNGSTTPGQYCAIPALSTEYLDSEYDITTLPPMQGIYVVAHENGATIQLDYNKHVWQAGSSTKGTTNMNEPMRAPQRATHNTMQRDDFLRMRLQVNSANSGADRLYIIQEHTTTRQYDNGYDAPNQLADGLANIYTNEPFGKMEVSCSNDIDSTYIGFQAGVDSTYCLSFNALIGQDIYIKDLSNDSIFLLTEGKQYLFTQQPLSTNDLRFQVILYPIFPDQDNGTEDDETQDDNHQPENGGITTDIDDLTNLHIWHNNNQLYITNAPANSVAKIYSISGQFINASTIQYSTHTIDIHHLQQGVYLLQLSNQMYKFVCQ